MEDPLRNLCLRIISIFTLTIENLHEIFCLWKITYRPSLCRRSYAELLFLEVQIQIFYSYKYLLFLEENIPVCCSVNRRAYSVLPSMAPLKTFPQTFLLHCSTRINTRTYLRVNFCSKHNS